MMLPARRQSSSRGFTLIEVVIAVGILAFLISIGYTALRNIMRSKQILDDGRELRFVTDSVLLRVSRELQLSYDKDLARMPDCGEQNAPPNPIADVFRGETGTLENIRADSITFLALEGGQYLPDGGGHSGVVQIRYFIVPTPPDDVTNGGPYTLVRQEIPYLKPFKRACQNQIVFPITNRIVGMQFSYYDAKKDSWSESWTYPEHDHLPGIVKFTITLRSAAGRETTFTSSVPLRGEI